MRRRTFLDLAALGVTSVAATGRRALAAPAAGPLDLEAVKAAPGRAVPLERRAGFDKDVVLDRSWDGGRCRATLHNRGKRPWRIAEVILFSVPHGLPAETLLYGESFQMLTQTGGTLGAPAVMGYDESKHYKLPQPRDVQGAITGALTLRPPGKDAILIGFGSCRKWAGRFFLRPGRLDAVVDTEGLTLAPGETWELEELVFASGPSRDRLLADLGARIATNHPPLKFPRPPTGWCSWYCFGAKVTAAQVIDNLDVIARRVPQLRYVQIDDGYQPAMGDWLDTGTAFGGDVQGVLKQIRQRGFEPAIWVAPFIAEGGSKLFQAHPDWFMKGADGKPLPADKVTFGGWRRGPWYALDGTHPEVQAHFTRLFATMRNDWGCTYFKLDANFWGAMHGGRLHDPRATRIEAYRRGMEAILKGAGQSFILGCNHPIWGSFGLIHGSRSSGDVKRTWDRFKNIYRQNLSRNWQNGRLWWNDSDAVCLTGNLSDEEFQFHATAVYASGGLILSGDDLTVIPPHRLAMLKKLLPPTAVAAEFDDETLRVGRMRVGGALMLCLFNEDDRPRTVEAALDGAHEVRDVWSGAALGRKQGALSLQLPPHAARLLECRPVKA
jgi:alpha-galactosidase